MPTSKQGPKMVCPGCGYAWRRREGSLPRVKCPRCGRTTQLPAPRIAGAKEKAE